EPTAASPAAEGSQKLAAQLRERLALARENAAPRPGPEPPPEAPLDGEPAETAPDENAFISDKDQGLSFL
ncbi:MAG: hypothetical protein QME74_04545, partial [Candidatus Edwardsbacteria bacterium]|nr:hypothetical protein [Candidatus Edwardsbacteria bacterium]